MSKERLLIVGDAAGVSAEQFDADGFTVMHARGREHACALVRGRSFDLMVLGDVGQGREALDLLEEVRTGAGWPGEADMPIVAVSSRATALDMLRAFELGADDFLAAPAGHLELRARVRAVLRRAPRVARQRVRVGAVEIDRATRRVSSGGSAVHLSRLEFELLSALAADPGRVFTKEELLRSVWGFRSPGATRTLDSHACRLRRKLGGAIVTVWGVGYRLAASG